MASSSTTKTVPKGQESRPANMELTMHRLKLEWITARDDAERRKISQEIRRQIEASSKP